MGGAKSWRIAVFQNHRVAQCVLEKLIATDVLGDRPSRFFFVSVVSWSTEVGAVEGYVPRARLVEGLVQVIASRGRSHLLRVAVDGPDTAGKTTLADELADNLRKRREEVIRVGIDGFHRPRSARLRRGSLSPEGFYHDSFDYDAVRRVVLDPLGPGGDRWYRTGVFDHRSDQAVDAPARLAPDGAVLLFDGVFMLRPELRDCWDMSIFVDVSAEETLRRALVRDAELLGGPDVVRERYQKRYLPGQGLYRSTAQPERAATVVIDNNDPAEPRVVKWFI